MIQHIRDIVNFTKKNREDLFIIIISVLAVTFFAGCITLFSEIKLKEQINIEKEAFDIPYKESTAKRSFVASKNGSKYYPIGCSSANRIKEENKLFFASASDAIAAGYERTSTCK